MRVLSFLIVGLLLTSSAAQAAPLTLSNLTGGWDGTTVTLDPLDNDDTGPTVNITDGANSDADIIGWGEGVSNPATKSGYIFDPIDGSFNPDLNTAFELGDFTAVNNTITSATDAFIGVDYNFSFDTNGDPSALSDVLSFVHNETLNAGPCPVGVIPCPDIVMVTILKLSSMAITVGTDIYIFELLGFSQDGTFGSFSDTFISPEGGKSMTKLWAQVTVGESDIPEVPEPASLGLLGAGLALVAHQVRRRRAARRNSSL
jgi:hypothetical protein